MSYQEEITTLVQEYNTRKSEFIEQSKELLKKAFNEFFETNPEVKTIVWEQYTPYFNDGDTCTFSVNDISFSNSPDGEDICYGEYTGDDETIWATTDCFYYKVPVSESTKENIETFSKAISLIPDEIFEDMLGDHVQIIASKTGFDVSEYDHD